MHVYCLWTLFASTHTTCIHRWVAYYRLLPDIHSQLVTCICIHVIPWRMGGGGPTATYIACSTRYSISLIHDDPRLYFPHHTSNDFDIISLGFSVWPSHLEISGHGGNDLGWVGACCADKCHNPTKCHSPRQMSEQLSTNVIANDKCHNIASTNVTALDKCHNFDSTNVTANDKCHNFASTNVTANDKCHKFASTNVTANDKCHNFASTNVTANDKYHNFASTNVTANDNCHKFASTNVTANDKCHNITTITNDKCHNLPTHVSRHITGWTTLSLVGCRILYLVRDP